MMKSFCLALLFITSLLAGCATQPTKNKPVSSKKQIYVQKKDESIKAPEYRDYSLLQDSYSRKSLFSDHRAMQVGDILTVRIVESATASGEADTSTSRKNTFSGILENFFGLNLHGHNELSGKNEMGFEGKGKTKRADQFSATITVKVVDVLPNGNLRIEGKRDLVINNEHRYIILKGIVRPEDISYNNEVLSTYIADAEVVYKGKGVIARRQGPGWGMWLLDLLLPF
ncbi:MAG: flagellar biosynthesis protein FlgH [Deltaproteobacteria bacterium]|nr:MAG: flagellar biosynthesis protein FlgH [Deltaproteobacteria bacterium]